MLRSLRGSTRADGAATGAATGLGLGQGDHAARLQPAGLPGKAKSRSHTRWDSSRRGAAAP
jgi:hypothetical protein